LLNVGEVSQSRPVSATDQASNKIFELLAGCFAMRCGTNVSLDDPDHSRGDNPDVLATIRGRQWGIACKVLHSVNPKTILDNIVEGLRQIRTSTAETGFVFLNLKNVLDHAKYWPVQNSAEWAHGAEPVFQAFIDVSIPRIFLEGEIGTLVAGVRPLVTAEELGSRFRQSRSLPGVVLYANVMSAVTGPNGKPVPLSQRWLTWAGTDSLTDDEAAVLDCFNHVSQDIP